MYSWHWVVWGLFAIRNGVVILGPGVKLSDGLWWQLFDIYLLNT